MKAKTVPAQTEIPFNVQLKIIFYLFKFFFACSDNVSYHVSRNMRAKSETSLTGSICR